MIKKYNFHYNAGKYILQYNNPNAIDEPFEISADNMQFDTKKFYMYIFSDVKEEIHIEIENNINTDNQERDVVKKGERVYKVIDDLCKEITNRLNKECFGEISD